MQSSKAAVLILSAITAASAQFPQPTNVDAVKSLKNVFQNLKTAGRRLAGPNSTECGNVCDTAGFLKAYNESKDAAEKGGDMTFLCPHLDAMECMATKDACKEADGDDDGDDNMDMIKCMCKCPVAGKLDKIKDEDMCKPENDMSCIFTESSCSSIKKGMLKNGSEADFKEGMDIHCKMMGLKCEKKGKEMGTCAADEMKTWNAGCEDAAKNGTLESYPLKADCCSAGKKMMDCYSPDCMKLQMQALKVKARDASDAEKEKADKEFQKNYNIGNACPNSGMPKSWSDVTPDSDAKAVTSFSWVSSLHALTCVVIVGSLLA